MIALDSKKATAAKPGAFLSHPCAICGSPYAPFGTGVALLQGRTGTWYCRDDLPVETPKGSGPFNDMYPAMPSAPIHAQQGKLL